MMYPVNLTVLLTTAAALEMHISRREMGNWGPRNYSREIGNANNQHLLIEF